MSRVGPLAAAAIVLLPFAWLNAELAESVGQYQLDATLICEFTETQCRGEWPNRRVMSRTPTWTTPEIPQCDRELYERITNGCPTGEQR
jgi:hypothetical protein